MPSNFEETSIRPASTKLKVLRLINVLSMLLFFFSNVYGLVFSRPNIAEISNKYPTYFTPSITFVSLFWLFQYIFEFGFAFYAQFSDIRIVQEVVENSVSLWFSLSNLFLCGWLFFWIHESFIISELFVLLILISTSIAHNRLIVNHTPNHIPDSVVHKIVTFTHIPFSMLSAFSWLDLFHNGFVAIAKDHKVDGAEYANVAVSLAWFLAIIGICWCITGVFSHGKRDGVFSFTVAWALLGVAVHQRKTKFLSITCGVLALTQIIVILVVWKRYGGDSYKLLSRGLKPTRSRIGDREREPLLQQQQQQE